jgi:hypothetical protein
MKKLATETRKGTEFVSVFFRASVAKRFFVNCVFDMSWHSGIFALVFVASSFHCAAQEPETGHNTIRIKKKFPTTPEEVGARFFKLFCKEAIDTMVMEFFPTKEIALEFCQQGNASSGELYRYVQDDYEGMKADFAEMVARTIVHDKMNYDPELDRMEIDSVTFDYPDSETWKAGTTWKLLNITVHASDGTNNHQFFIIPLYGYEDRWYVFSTEYGFSEGP